MRKGIRRYVWPILFLLLLLSMSMNVLAADAIDENLGTIYESEDIYRSIYLANPEVDATLTEETEAAMDAVTGDTNVLRIYAGDTGFSELSEEEASAVMDDYLEENDLDNDDICMIFYRDSKVIYAFTTSGFDDAYGEETLGEIEKLAYSSYQDDSNSKSFETIMLEATAGYFNGERPEKTEEAAEEELFDFSENSEIALTQEANELNYQNKENENQALLQDEAGLLTEQGAQEVLSSMQPLTEYENVLFVTTNSNNDTPKYYAWDAGNAAFGSDSDYSVFLIDMDNRQIYLYSSESIYHTISTDKANVITDNVYRYATNGDYASCASKAFEQMLTVFEGKTLFSIMRIICSLLLALGIGLTACWLMMSRTVTNKRASVKEIQSGMGSKEVTVKNIQRKLISTHFVRESSGSGGGGGHSGGGGGGFSGGGGGGGGHGF